MAEILSQSEQSNVAALLNNGKFKFYWIGLNDMAFEGKFEWQHSFTPLGNYTNWIPGEPSNTLGDEDCVIMVVTDNWSWNDFHCDRDEWKPDEIHALCQY